MSGLGYAIPDEPSPTRFGRTVVTPFATLLGCMLGGTVPGLAWMVWNGWAMGSATRVRETVYALLGLVAMAATLVAIGFAIHRGAMPRTALPYLVHFVRCVPLVAVYRIQLMQSRSFELHRHFGGAVFERGWAVALVLLYLRIRLEAASDGRGILHLLATF